MFVSLEGPEGAGKSTIARSLADRLREIGVPTLTTYEPGGTELGRRLRDVLLHGSQVEIEPRAEALLFSAARAQLVEEVIRPHLLTGGVVICDRYADSTLAYQCIGRGLALEPVRGVLDFAVGGLWPDLTLLLDVDARVGLARNRAAEPDATVDRFESEEVDFHERVRRGYLALAAAEPERWYVVDASKPLGQVLVAAWQAVERRMTLMSVARSTPASD